MSKGRLSSHERNSSRPPIGTGEVHRFLGISLSGGKADKACVAVVEYYPAYKKIFLSKIFDRIKSEGSLSADLKIHEIIESYRGQLDMIAFDVPWRPPLCFRCEIPCPGYENCPQEHIVWMREYNQKQQSKKKPKKLFTPYTERCVEMYLKTEIEESIAMGPAMGANTAPLLARASYIQRRVNVPAIEVYPKLSIWRLGRALDISKSHLRYHRHSVGGNDSRRIILKNLSENNVAFVYDQDFRLMIDNNHAFEAFICALTAYLKYKGQTEPRPQGFPAKEDWVEFPKKVPAYF
jgi:hypothetical protein